MVGVESYRDYLVTMTSDLNHRFGANGLQPRLVDAVMSLDCEIVVQVRMRDADPAEHREQMSREQMLHLLIQTPDLLRSRYGHLGFQKVQEVFGREPRERA